MAGSLMCGTFLATPMTRRESGPTSIMWPFQRGLLIQEYLPSVPSHSNFVLSPTEPFESSKACSVMPSHGCRPLPASG